MDVLDLTLPLSTPSLIVASSNEQPVARMRNQLRYPVTSLPVGEAEVVVIYRFKADLDLPGLFLALPTPCNCPDAHFIQELSTAHWNSESYRTACSCMAY